MSHAPALEIRNLHAWYGESHILHGVDLDVARGEVVTLLGRNGAGRTTTLRAILGLTGARRGSVRIGGVESISMPTHRIAHLGVGYCPEERGIFASLSCEENLMLPPPLRGTGERAMSVEEIYEMFPNLRERRHSPAPGCPVASSKCWRWRGYCARAPTSCCWTRSPRGWRRSSYRPSRA